MTDGKGKRRGHATESTSACMDGDWRGGVGIPGTFIFDSPSDDVVSYRYGFNNNPSPNTVVSPEILGGPASVVWTPIWEGPNLITVEAVDRAGLPSSVASCTFFVLG